MKEKDKRNLLKILKLLIQDEINTEVSTKDFFQKYSDILDKGKIQNIINSFKQD